MRIGIVGPFNPAEFKVYLNDNNVPEMHLNASAVQALVKSFLDAGHTVYVYTVNESNVYQEFISERLKVYAVPYRLVPRTSIFQIYKVRQLRKAIKKTLREIEVLHAHWTYEYAYAAKAFAKKIPVFCTVRDWCPYIMTIVRKSLLGKIGWDIKYFMFRRVMACKDVHLIANSQYTYLRITEAYPNRDAVIIPNSIKRNLILTSRKKKIIPLKLITIANGINDPRKNIVNLLRAFSLVRKDYADATLTIVGKYKKDNRFYMEWEKEGLLDSVITTGQLNHEDVIAQIDKSSILIHPSLEETFGNILLEAMARRVPVVGGQDSGAVPQVLGEGKYGICCDVNSPEMIYYAIQQLTDEKKYDTLVHEATNHLLSNYASDVVCDKHIKEYEKYLSK